ncbi:MAG TPA: hypothetical protein VJY62_04185 [Bacteroidia bacterium]|nr:hypothetical protein [Bacteroidia bacterium]
MHLNKKIPFDFVLDYLFQVNPVVKSMFGSYAIYLGNKIMLVLRDKKDHQEANGVWMATSREYHESLKKDFPSMCSVYVLSEGKSETNWQMIPASADDFESSVIKCCEFILQNDPRIGRIPKPKKKRSHKAAKAQRNTKRKNFKL